MKEISSYITRYNPDVAGRLNEKIKQQCKLLANFPNMGQSFDNFASGLRSFPVEDYLIFYRPIDGGVEVVRIVSGYRDLETVFLSEDIPYINEVVVSVHCHDDLGMAVDNSLIALSCGVRQIECAINGLGARKGNADFSKVVMEVSKQENYQLEINTSLMSKAAELIFQITGIGEYYFKRIIVK